ncbi:diaminopimelate decarboxylase [Olivibacter ginsenosidimutans]|uniref:Diaminopimelate decarboxylase n=1 Tax=Olivibacter ginsenosidimutans TaxID=1176537 RepID=A0ABP9B0L2_9SPHI
MFNKATIAAFGQRETPFFYYDLTLLQATLDRALAAAENYGFHVHYALKANFNERILQCIQKAGLGADCVSGNEVLKAVQTGFDVKKIVFAGVGKSDKEILIGLEHDIFCFNVESVQELEVIGKLAKEHGKVAKIALRINPNVDAQTHQYITTGLDENKFGIKTWELADCLEIIKKYDSLEFIGLHFHVGSQIVDLNVFKSLCVKVNEFNNWFDERGYRLKVLNVGGGLGVNYVDPDKEPIVDFAGYFEIFNQFLERKGNQEVHFELGRALVSQCGSLVSRVLYVKRGLKKHFLVLDAGMTELMRPALYQAYHKIEHLSTNAVKDAEGIKVTYDVVGPICESTDCFGKEVELPEVNRGDLIAIRTAGAYGEVMASRYNLRNEIRYVYDDEITP